MSTMGKLILASGSPARARLLTAAGHDFEGVRPDFDEDPIKAAMAGMPAAEVALALAHKKAACIDAGPGTLVLGSDQMLDCDGRWLNKPGDRQGLKTQIAELQGRTHRLHAAAVLMRNRHIIWRDVSHADLSMRPLSDQEIDAYVDAAPASVLNCVGGYEIEGLGITLFDKIEGDLFTIQGLPLLPVLAALRTHL